MLIQSSNFLLKTKVKDLTVVCFLTILYSKVWYILPISKKQQNVLVSLNKWYQKLFLMSSVLIAKLF